jgi:hypothetical protein
MSRMTALDYAEVAAFEAARAPQENAAAANSQEGKAWLDVRIPQPLFDQLRTSAITVPMFMAMGCLYRWSDWYTGNVAHASAGGLRKATGNACPLRTIQRAMKRLEEMGLITRHIIEGSHEDYSVTIHNYKWLDEHGHAHILNPMASGDVARKMARKMARKVTRNNHGEVAVKETTSSVSSVDGGAEGGADVCADGGDKILYKGTSIKETSIENKVNLLSPNGDDPQENRKENTTAKPLSPIGDDRSLYSHLDDVWNYYLEATHRNPRRNKFDSIKRRIGIVRLRECMAKVRGHPESAVKLMKGAIDALKRSSFHMGCDEKSDGKKYNDWKHVFGTYETMEGWWNTY